MDNYSISLLYLTHSVIRYGVILDKELEAMSKLFKHEKISKDDHNGFLSDIDDLATNQIFNKGFRGIEAVYER